MGVTQKGNFSVTLPQEDFAKDNFSVTFAETFPTTPEIWAARQEPLLADEIELCQCKLGELRWLRSVGSARAASQLCKDPMFFASMIRPGQKRYGRRRRRRNTPRLLTRKN